MKEGSESAKHRLRSLPACLCSPEKREKKAVVLQAWKVEKKKNGEETTFFRFVNKLFVLCILRLCSWEKWERASLSRTCRRVEVKKQK